MESRRTGASALPGGPKAGRRRPWSVRHAGKCPRYIVPSGAMNRSPRSRLSYRDAGVDVDRANDLVARIRAIADRTPRGGVLAGLGGFGALFELPLHRYRAPVLVSGADGVGTKLKLAAAMDAHDTIGIDLVAMCVNDVLVHGAEPLFLPRLLRHRQARRRRRRAGRRRHRPRLRARRSRARGRGDGGDAGNVRRWRLRPGGLLRRHRGARCDPRRFPGGPRGPDRGDRIERTPFERLLPDPQDPRCRRRRPRPDGRRGRAWATP